MGLWILTQEHLCIVPCKGTKKRQGKKAFEDNMKRQEKKAFEDNMKTIMK
jgi:hypothetical protein